MMHPRSPSLSPSHNKPPPPTHHFLWMCDDNRKHRDLCSRPVCSFLSCPLASHSSIFSPPLFFTQEEAPEGTEEKLWHVMQSYFAGAVFFCLFGFFGLQRTDLLLHQTVNQRIMDD